jgi:lipopolysaccharide transport system permease protein
MLKYDNFHTIYRYRWLLYELVLRDLKMRYRGSVLGFAWTLLNPIIFMAIYTLVFSVYLKSAYHAYPLLLLSGIVPFTWFAGAVGQGVTSIVDGRTYVGKTLLPTEFLVLVPVLSNGINFLVSIVLLLPVSLLFGVGAVWALIFLPLLVAIELCIVLGFTLLLASLNVFYRDLQQLAGYAVTALLFLTPIFYTRSAVPANLQFLVTVNPFAALISSYQDVFYYGRPPGVTEMLFAASFGIVLLAAALRVFNSYRDSFAEYV